MNNNNLPSYEERWLDLSRDEKVGQINPNKTLWDLLYEYNKDGMNDISINFLGKKITYEELFEKIDEVEKSFRASGVKAGDIVPLVLATVPEAAFCLYALNKIGATACIIDPRLNEERMLGDVSSTKSDIIISLKNASKALRNLKSATDISDVVMLSALNSANSMALRKLFDIKDFFSGNIVLPGAQKWATFIKNGVNQISRTPNYVENLPAAIIYTGGTTGVHKGVLLSNEALNMTVLEHRYLIDDVERGEKFFDILPPFIAYGLTSLHLAFSYGLETIMNPVPDPAKFAEQLHSSHAAIAFGGPIHWEAVTHTPGVEKMDFSNLKFPVSGGEKLPKEVAERIDETLEQSGCKVGIYDGYGASECCGVFSLYQPSKNSIGTVGYPLRFNKMCVINPETMEELDYNEQGEICIYGPSIMNGYYDNEAETNKVFFVDELGRKWLKTGDLGFINKKGELTITGRLKRIFVCGVNKIYPPELEELINSFEEVRKCVVTGVDDLELRTVPKVHLILNDNTDYEDVCQRISELIEAKIGKEAVPKYYQLDDDFLYTGSGKIDYMQMTKVDNEMHQITNSKTLKKGI